MDAEAYHVSVEFIGYCTATFNKSDNMQGYSSNYQENSMLDEGSCSEAEPFALQVHGDSMEPEFKHGCIIVIDPAGVLKHECFVVAKNDDGLIFRQLIIDGDRYILRPLNPVYDEEEMYLEED